jgi:hypothetical protein
VKDSECSVSRNVVTASLSSDCEYISGVDFVSGKSKTFNARSDLLSAVLLKIHVFRDVTPCLLVDISFALHTMYMKVV